MLGVDFAGGGLRSITLTGVLTGAWESWPLLVGTHPPVEATGTVLLAPAMAGVIVAAQATAFSRAGSRPGWPVAPILGLLAWVLVTGSRQDSVGHLVPDPLRRPVRARLPGLGGGPGRAAPTRRRPPAGLLAAPVLVVSTLLAVPLGGPCSVTASNASCCASRTPRRTASTGSRRRWTASGGTASSPATCPTTPGGARCCARRSAPAGTVLRFTVLNRYDGQRWVAANDVEPGSHEDRFQLFGADYLTTPAEAGHDADPDRPHRLVEQPVAAARRPAGRAEPRLPGRRAGARAALQPGHLDRDRHPDPRRQRRVRVLRDLPRHPSSPSTRGPSGLWTEATYDAAAFLDNWARAARQDPDSRMDAVLPGRGDDARAGQVQRRRVRLGGAVHRAARTRPGSTTS